jgi:hypothetical protein
VIEVNARTRRQRTKQAVEVTARPVPRIANKAASSAEDISGSLL